MGELLEEFSSLLERYQVGTPGGMVEALLDQMKPDKAKHFRLCAIPHQFSPAILMALAPELNEEVANLEYHEFRECPSVRTYEGKLCEIKEESRSYLFKQWLEPGHAEEFVRANERLLKYFAQQREAAKCADRDAMRLNCVFHLIGADQSNGFDEFEKLFRERRHRSSPGECEVLIKLVHEYDPVLSASQVVRLAYQEGKLAADRAQWDKARALFDQVLGFSDLEPAVRARTLSRLGMLEAENRRWQMAIKRYEEALALAKNIPDATQANKLGYRIKQDLGVAYRDMGDLLQAKKLLRESIYQANRIKSFAGMAVGFNSLGTLYRKLGESKVAIKAYERSLKLLQSEEQPFRVAQVYNNLGLAYLDERKWEMGEKALMESLEIKRKAGDTVGMGRTYNNLMQVYRIQMKALEKKRKAAGSTGLSKTENNMVQDGQQQKPKEKAIDAADKALTFFKEVGDYYDMALVMRNLGRLYRGMGMIGEATNYFQQATAAFGKVGATVEASALNEELARLTHKIKVPWLIWISFILSGIICLLCIVFVLAIVVVSLTD